MPAAWPGLSPRSPGAASRAGASRTQPRPPPQAHFDGALIAPRTRGCYAAPGRTVLRMAARGPGERRRGRVPTPFVPRHPMIVVMKPGASQRQIDHVIERIEALGLRSHVIVGT